jgi:hypothetical protein
MRNLILVLSVISPTLNTFGAILGGLDLDKEGADDRAADLLIFSSKIISSIMLGLPLPMVPAGLISAVGLTVTGNGRVTQALSIISPTLTLGAGILAGLDGNTDGLDDRAADGLAYAAQAVNAILLGLPLPPVPVALHPDEAATKAPVVLAL